jgi:hypothetical protein
MQKPPILFIKQFWQENWNIQEQSILPVGKGVRETGSSTGLPMD